MQENIKCKDMLELIYKAEENILDEKIKKINRQIREKIKDIDTQKILENSSNLSELSKAFEQIEENYSIKISAYMKESYKQGFIDGVNLMLNCLKWRME